MSWGILNEGRSSSTSHSTFQRDTRSNLTTDFPENMITLETFLPGFLIACALLTIAHAIWAFIDARRRGRSGVLIALLVLWSFPLGVLIWLYLRPELLSGRGLEFDSPNSGEAIRKRANAGLL